MIWYLGEVSSNLREMSLLKLKPPQTQQSAKTKGSKNIIIYEIRNLYFLDFPVLFLRCVFKIHCLDTDFYVLKYIEKKFNIPTSMYF